MAKNRTAKEGTDIVQKKVDEEEANNAEIGDQFWIYSGQRLEVERPKEELEKRANTLRDMIENVRDGIPPGGGGRSWRRGPTTRRTRPTGSRPRQHNWTRRTPTNRKFLYISISVPLLIGIRYILLVHFETYVSAKEPLSGYYC